MHPENVFTLRWRHNGRDSVSNNQRYSTVYPNADQRKHQSSASLAFVREIHRSPVTRKIFPFHDVIMKWKHRYLGRIAIEYTLVWSKWNEYIAIWAELLLSILWYDQNEMKTSIFGQNCYWLLRYDQDRKNPLNDETLIRILQSKGCILRGKSWWRHQMETFSALLAICAGNSPVPGEFPTQRPATRSFDVFFDLHPIKRLSKQTLARLVIWDAIASIMTSS